MARTKPVTLHILDKDYIIACPAEQSDNLLASVDYLTKKMQEVRESGKVVSTERIAVMAALNIVHELLHCREIQGQNSAPKLNLELQRLEQKVSRALDQIAMSEV